MNGIDFLADTNFLIFTSQKNPIVESFLDFNIAISFISEMELLGVFSISKIQKTSMQNIINECFVIEMSLNIKQKAILLKQKYKLKLPDALLQQLLSNIIFLLFLPTQILKTSKN